MVEFLCESDGEVEVLHRELPPSAQPTDALALLQAVYGPALAKNWTAGPLEGGLPLAWVFASPTAEGGYFVAIPKVEEDGELVPLAAYLQRQPAGATPGEVTGERGSGASPMEGVEARKAVRELGWPFLDPAAG